MFIFFKTIFSVLFWPQKLLYDLFDFLSTLKMNFYEFYLLEKITIQKTLEVLLFKR